MFPLRKLIAAATLATVALFAAPGQQVRAATELESIQTAVIGEDYTFNTTLATPTSVPIGPVSYAFTFTPAAFDTVLTAVFEYIPFQLPGQAAGTFTGGFVTWSNGGSPITQALVAGVRTTLAIPLSAAGPDQTLTVGFGEQSGLGFLVGGVTTVPLPASGLLLLAGLGAITAVRRRGAKQAA